MSQAKLYALKGDFAARVRGTTGPYKPFLNATAGQISMSIETMKQKSNGNTPGTISEDETGRDATFEVTLQSRHKDNLKKFLYANSREIAASTAPVAFTLPAGEAGDIVNLGASNITATTFGGLTAGVDYKVQARSGSIEYLTNVAVTEGTFAHAAYTEFGIFSADAVEMEILFTSEKSGHSYVLYRVKLSPAQAYQLVSDGNDYASAQLTGTLLIDSGAPVDGNLGQYGRVRSID
jgi:hypothetical protein